VVTWIFVYSFLSNRRYSKELVYFEITMSEDIIGELDRSIELLLNSAHDLTNRMADKQRALEQARDLQQRANALVRALEQCQGPLLNMPEEAATQVREFTNQTMALRDYVRDRRPVEDRANRVVNLSHAMMTLVDPIGSGAIRNIKHVVYSIKHVGDFVRTLQPKTLSKNKTVAICGVYDTLLETLGWMGRAKLENDDRSQVLLTAAMSTYQGSMNMALSDKTESMHNPAPGGKRKVNGKPRGRGAISAMTAPAPPLLPVPKDLVVAVGTVAPANEPLPLPAPNPNPTPTPKKQMKQEPVVTATHVDEEDDLPVAKKTKALETRKVKVKKEPKYSDDDQEEEQEELETPQKVRSRWQDDSDDD